MIRYVGVRLVRESFSWACCCSMRTQAGLALLDDGRRRAARVPAARLSTRCARPARRATSFVWAYAAAVAWALRRLAQDAELPACCSAAGRPGSPCSGRCCWPAALPTRSRLRAAPVRSISWPRFLQHRPGAAHAARLCRLSASSSISNARIAVLSIPTSPDPDPVHHDLSVLTAIDEARHGEAARLASTDPAVPTLPKGRCSPSRRRRGRPCTAPSRWRPYLAPGACRSRAISPRPLFKMVQRGTVGPRPRARSAEPAMTSRPPDHPDPPAQRRPLARLPRADPRLRAVRSDRRRRRQHQPDDHHHPGPPGSIIVRIGAPTRASLSDRRGIEAALRLSADVIVNTDADDQYHAKDVSKASSSRSSPARRTS